jgi:two-component system, chemotaxis family, protein-glutamate methylesterase/glutaminase
MAGHDIIVIGASAGGVEALSQLVRGLPGDLAAAVFVVLHVPAHGTSVLPSILSRNGPLPARHPDDGEPIEHGKIYVAPPDSHLLIRRGQVRLSRGPRENGHRPSVDPLFRTAARSYGRRVVGVVLSGSLDDGTAGLSAVKQRGGKAIVQDPDDALYPGMPRSALESVDVDHRLPVSQIAPILVGLADEPVEEGAEPVPDDMDIESEMAAFELDALQNDQRPGTPSAFACPDCAGVLWELQDGELIRFRCRVGHAWTANSLLAQQSEGIETALWTALRALEERAALSNRIAERMHRRGNDRTALRFEEQAHEARQRAAILREVLITEPNSNAEPGPEGSGEAGRTDASRAEGPEPNG